MSKKNNQGGRFGEVLNTWTWQTVRAAYILENPFCERCKVRGLLVPAEIVHHRVYINNNNKNDPNELFNADNLESLCRQCHADEHKKDFTGATRSGKKKKRRFEIDEDGRTAPPSEDFDSPALNGDVGGTKNRLQDFSKLKGSDRPQDGPI